MKNRASARPPQEYFAGYESQSLSEKDEHVSSHERKPSQAAIMLKDEGAGDNAANRQSGIFKFGSKLAATFNPSNWKLWQKEKEKPVEDTSIAERLKADAEFKRAYEEVKKRGYIKGNRPAAMASAEKIQRLPNTEHTSDIAIEDASMANTPTTTGETRETATRTIGQNSPTKDPRNVNTPRRPRLISQTGLKTKYQRPFPRIPIQLPAVTPEDSISNYSPSSTSPRRGPSLLLAGAFRDDPTRPTRGRIIDPSPFNPLAEGKPQHLSPDAMKKQLSLVHKVSMLEVKLHKAREELALTMGTPVPAAKTKYALDYEAIHAIQLKHQMRNGQGHMPTIASHFMPGYYARVQEELLADQENTAGSELDVETKASAVEHSPRAPLAPRMNAELSPPSRVPDAIPESPVNKEDIDSRSTAGTEVHVSKTNTTSQEKKTNETTRRRTIQSKKTDNVFEKEHEPFHDSDEGSANESADEADSMVTRKASVKRVISGPNRRSVQVSEVSDVVPKHRSAKGRLEAGERGRSLKRAGDNAEFLVPELPQTRQRTVSEASVKSNRSSRIPRPRSRAGTPAHETAPPVPAIPVERLEQASLIPKRTASTKSTKAAKASKTAASRISVEIPSHQHLETPVRKDARTSRETTPTPKTRRKSGVATLGGTSRISKSPSHQSTDGMMTRSGSTKGGLHGKEKEMSPSKEGTFEWGPDVF